MGVIDRLKEVPKVLPQLTGVPVHLPSLLASHGHSGLYNDCERSEADGPDISKGSVVRQRKKATHKCSRTEGGFPGPAKFQGPVPEPNSVGCYGQLNSGSLHKQTRRNPLSDDVRSPVEDHDLVPSLPDNIKSQTHSRVSECDG